jgi:hypothetical protein
MRRLLDSAPALGLALVACSAVMGLCALPGEIERTHDGLRCAADERLVSDCGPWLGASVRPLPGESTTDAVRRFERLSGQRLDIVHVYMRGDDPFPTTKQVALTSDPRRRRILFVSWKPDIGHTWSEVAAGAADARIDRAARRLRTRLDEPFFLGVHHEPEDEVRPDPGSGFTARDYAAMYRHVVERLRSHGVDDAVTVMNYMGFRDWAQQPWYADLYPGDDVVDWLAFDLYATHGLGGQQGDFADLVDPDGVSGQWPGNYDWAAREHPDKPLMLAEWGVGEHPQAPGWKAGFFDSVADALPDLDRLGALVYFSDHDAPKAGDTRPDTSAPSTQAFRSMVAAVVDGQPIADLPGYTEVGARGLRRATASLK